MLYMLLAYSSMMWWSSLPGRLIGSSLSAEEAEEVEGAEEAEEAEEAEDAKVSK